VTALSHICTGDFRNEGWTLIGSGVSRLFHCWNNDDDTKYCKCPANKGRACVTFPTDITTVPDGAVITSVTIKIRCAKQDSQKRTVTVNVLCQDDPSKFTSRTISPTQTIADYEVATYTRDPLGLPWDIHRINKLLCQVFSYSGAFDCIRVYKVFAVINYRVRPTLTVDNPTGTQLTPSPVISWTYSQTDGDLQSSAQYQVFTAIQAADSSFNPDTTDPVYQATVSGDTTSVTLPTSLNADSYVTYVRVTSSFGAKSLWASRAFSVQGPSPGVPSDDNTVSGTPGIGVISVVPDNYSSSVSLQLRNTSNLLSVQQADFETTTDGLEYVTTNCAIVQDTSVSYAGVASGKLTASSAATMSVRTTAVRCAELTPVTARAQFRSAVIGRTFNIRALFFDDSFTALTGTLTGTGTDSASTWKEGVVTGASPAGTKWARVELEIVSPANAEVHSIDHVGLMYGAGALWSDGGHASQNILSAFSATAEDPVGTNWLAGTGSTIGRVTPSGTGAHGLQTKRLTYDGITPSLGFRATGANFNSTSSGTDFTLNKPAGVTTGDLLLAFVTSSQTGTITAPAGWTAVNTASVDDGSTDTALFVLKRTAGGSEPSTWTDGQLGTASTRRNARVIAYSGAADASAQFVAEGTTSRATDTPLYLTSAVLNNTDSNAWRVAAFAVNDDVGSGTMVANIAPPVTTLPISYVGKGTAWSTTSGVTSYTINRPSGVVSGDLMLACVTISDSVTPIVTAPAGWTVVRQFISSDSFASCTMAILKRTAGSSEPTSWTGTLSATVKPVITESVAYRNCDLASNQFIAENQSVSGSGNTITTASVTNTDSTSWRMEFFGYSGDYFTSGYSSEVTNRDELSQEYQISSWSYRTATLRVSDSNGPVGTGSHSRTGTLNRSYYAAGSWIGLLKQLPSAPAAGANETERVDEAAGSSNPFMYTGIYDSNAPVATGSTSVTASFTPGSGTSIQSAASWIGLIRPAVPLTAGLTVGTMPDAIEISGIEDWVMEQAGNQVSFLCDFLGSTAGTPYLTLYFYRANQLISSQTRQGTSFGTSVWSQSAAVFDVPDGTTRIKGEISVTDRQIGDFVYFDRVGIMLGSTVFWRNGTGRSTHAVWSSPHLQYADDDGSGYGPWLDLPGQTVRPPAFDPGTGLMQYTDQTVIPLNSRKYRAQTVSYGLAGDRFVSGYGPDSDVVSLTARNWWIKDLRDPGPDTGGSQLLRVKAEPIGVGTTNTAAVFQPLGEDLPVVITEGYKGDTLQLTLILNRQEHANLRALLNRGRTLFLQSDIDHAWWVRPVGDLKAEVQVTWDRKANPVRFFSLTFVQVAAEL
jgi:hypothetical protein